MSSVHSESDISLSLCETYPGGLEPLCTGHLDDTLWDPRSDVR